jgi:hypothetical protein
MELMPKRRLLSSGLGNFCPAASEIPSALQHQTNLRQLDIPHIARGDLLGRVSLEHMLLTLLSHVLGH